ncbi:hypothetical protein [Flavobacterium frigoris]|uniref:Lipoprotein n=1 Tax=Flavobacterium frigoris (strain PS1) TaxID=1086011 RepID=H7FMV1_FLAFP|nr:hypothetical protein [Flavobacterium frigoris]EIA10202.1 hypothetical protein HJ01_00499 [Flavobacterium frigoris PS1]
MKYLYYTLLATVITFTSCKNDETAAVKTNPRNEIPFWQQTSPAVQGQSSQSTGIQNGSSGMATSTPAGINPPHGELNHRCDVAVGAPLNTAGSGGTSVQPASVQSTQAVTTSQNITAKTVTPKGMNPSHGESGHRCDIAVGAPLNSKPASTTTATTSTNSATAAKEYTVQPAVPALLSTASADTETAAGMNPAHGKAGHRCDIAVGEPLPKS